uniref:Eukaryotic translation initiation factor 4E binding protein 2 n=1 Tax=Anabas testudineus TaxID=64144 RepID=A0AAQ6IKN0_ANATE
MSTSRQLSESRAIPTRTVFINETTQLPHDYCTTPGGTLFSTTPGGTRIIYDRKFLLDRRNSPIAQTPPAHLPVIPGVTSQNVLNENRKNEANNHINNHDGKPTTGMNYVMQNLLNGEYMTYYCSKSLMYLKSLLGRF